MRGNILKNSSGRFKTIYFNKVDIEVIVINDGSNDHSRKPIR